MPQPTQTTGRWHAFWQRWHARRAARWQGTTRFVRPPEPRQFGAAAQGRHWLAGDCLIGGQLVNCAGRSLWDIAAQNPEASADLHACAWLGDLAALGNSPARDLARDWVFDWIKRYGAGDGAGWDPALTGARLIRWIDHSDFMLRKQDHSKRAALLSSLGRQAQFLVRRAQTAPVGLPRLHALAGLVHASVMLDGFARHSAPALRALLAQADALIDPSGTIPSRNPAQLLLVFCLLTDIAHRLAGAGQPAPAGLTQIIAKIAPTLRGLRHTDGALARFHDGSASLAGQMDQALAVAGKGAATANGLYMGYARMAAGRVSLILDAAAPQAGSHSAHASTLGFELTSGRRPVIVSCGSGAPFGPDWHRASRASASHATLTLADHSSAQITPQGALANAPKLVRADLVQQADGVLLESAHDGYRARYGLTHARMLHLSQDGRALSGTDLLTTLADDDQRLFDSAFDQTLRAGLGFAIRFHLHPQVTASLDAATGQVVLRLISGETWAFTHDGTAQISLSPSVYLENGQLKPRATQQVVLSGNALAYATRVRWSLAKTQDTPLALRDLVLATPLADFDEV